MKGFFEDLKNQSRSNARTFASSKLIMNVTEDILLALEKTGITKKELGERLGKSKTHVGQVLNGERNMTLSTLSDLCFELDLEPVVMLTSITPEENKSIKPGWVKTMSLPTQTEIEDTSPTRTREMPSNGHSSASYISVSGMH